MSIASVECVRFATGLLLAAVLLAPVGCGDDAEPEADSASSPEQEIADQVTRFWEDVEAGDGEAACSATTGRGQRMWVRWSDDDPELDEVGTCPDAVVQLSEAWAEQGGESVRGPDGSFSADDVWIDGDEAEVQCRYRGAMLLTRVDGEWLMRIPACHD